MARSVRRASRANTGAKGDTGATGAKGDTGAAGASGAVANGYERVSGTASSSTSSNKSAAASCPTGKVAVGGGFTTSRSDVGAQQSRATANDTWTVDAVEIVSTNNNWTVQAYVICVNQ